VPLAKTIGALLGGSTAASTGTSQTQAQPQQPSAPGKKASIQISTSTDNVRCQKYPDAFQIVDRPDKLVNTRQKKVHAVCWTPSLIPNPTVTESRWLGIVESKEDTKLTCFINGEDVKDLENVQSNLNQCRPKSISQHWIGTVSDTYTRLNQVYCFEKKNLNSVNHKIEGPDGKLPDPAYIELGCLRELRNQVNPLEQNT